jgi:hypothetical protein
MLNLRFDVPFFQRGKFPASVSNASQEIIVPNPWTGRANSAPFDQRMSSRACTNLKKKNFDFFFLIAFYLILDVAVGGTNGWFPDGAGNKPWLNGALGVCYYYLFIDLVLGFVTLGSSLTAICLCMQMPCKFSHRQTTSGTRHGRRAKTIAR